MTAIGTGTGQSPTRRPTLVLQWHAARADLTRFSGPKARVGVCDLCAVIGNSDDD